MRFAIDDCFTLLIYATTPVISCVYGTIKVISLLLSLKEKTNKQTNKTEQTSRRITMLCHMF